MSWMCMSCGFSSDNQPVEGAECVGCVHAAQRLAKAIVDEQQRGTMKYMVDANRTGVNVHSEWRKKNPQPGDVVLYCLGERMHPAHVIAITGKGLTLRVLLRNADMNRDDVAFSEVPKNGCWCVRPDPQGPVT